MQLMPVNNTSDAESVSFTFITDGIEEESNETLELKLVPLPSSLQTMPNGEAVFFRNSATLSILDANRKFYQTVDSLNYSRSQYIQEEQLNNNTEKNRNKQNK